MFEDEQRVLILFRNSDSMAVSVTRKKNHTRERKHLKTHPHTSTSAIYVFILIDWKNWCTRKTVFEVKKENKANIKELVLTIKFKHTHTRPRALHSHTTAVHCTRTSNKILSICGAPLASRIIQINRRELKESKQKSQISYSRQLRFRLKKKVIKQEKRIEKKHTAWTQKTR